MNNQIENPNASRFKQTTLACEKCRALKVKCVRVQQDQPCIKCAKSNSQCVVPARRRPARPAQRTKPRLVDLESKLGDILVLVSRSNAPVDSENTTLETPGFSAMADSSRQDQQTAKRAQQEQLMGLDFTDALALSDNLMASQSFLDGDYAVSANMHCAWITDLGLSPTVLQHLLETFRRMNSYFPFVLISGDSTPASMIEERPFLLLAAVASASSQYHHLQTALIEKVKQTLSHRVLVAGERDLDLLQGLLVHLAWFHFHLVPRSEQTYRYLQIAISMVMDLRLEEHLQDCHRSGPSDPSSREACRAYLGCYYISSVIAASTAKPNTLHFTESMLQYAAVLKQEQEFETDELIYPLIKLQHFSEEVCELYRPDSCHIPHPWPYMHAGRFIMRLEEWWSTLTADVQRYVLLINGYHAMKIRIHEMGLVYQYGQKKPPRPAGSEDQPLLSTPPMVIVNLVKCATSTKEYLDCFLEIPTTEYGSLPLSIWYQVILAIFVLYRLSVGLPDVPEWNTEVAQQTADLQGYLALLVDRLSSTRTESEGQSPNRCLFAMFAEIVESVKTSYGLAREHAQPQSPSQDGPHAHENFRGAASSRLSSVQSNQKYRCPGFQNLNHDAAYAPGPSNSTGQCPLDGSVAEEIGRIENESFWDDLLTADALAGLV